MKCEYCGEEFLSRPMARQILDRVLFFCSERCAGGFDRLGLPAGPPSDPLLPPARR